MGGKYLILLLFLFISLAVRFFTQPTESIPHKVSFTTTLLQESTRSTKTQTFTVSLPKRSFFSQTQQVQIITGLFPSYHYGDTLAVSGSIKQRMARGSSPQNVLYFPAISYSSSFFSPVLRFTANLRQQVSDFYTSTLPPTSAKLLVGIVFGIKLQQSADFTTMLKSTGVMHVIAASGMNVSVVSSFLSAVLLLFVRRQLALMLVMVGIFFYAMLSGFEASIVRASIMGSLVCIAQVTGRQYNTLYALLVTGFLMLFIEPNLIADAGFQLSFLSTLGILLFTPLLEPIFSKDNAITKIFSQDLIATITSQIMTIPVLLSTFGQYALVSVLVNALVLWLIPVLMFLGAVGALASFIFVPLGKLFLLLSLPLLLYFEQVVTFFGSKQWNIVTTMSVFMVLAYYCFVTSLFLAFKLRGRAK